MQQRPHVLKKRTPASSLTAGKTLPKEVTDEQKQSTSQENENTAPAASSAGVAESSRRPEASIAAGVQTDISGSIDSEYGSAAQGTRTPESQEHEGQLNLRAMLELPFSAKYEKWRALNKGTQEHEFVTLLRAEYLPKAVKREYPPTQAPRPDKLALWCCYCGEWMRFVTFSYTGYSRCVGCGISTKDFHNARANKIFDH